MSEIVRYVGGAPAVTRQVVTGSSVNINLGGGSGTADAIALNPVIAGYGNTVQEAIAELVTSVGGVLPSGGAAGEVLGVAQASPRTLSWVNQIDGGTFN